MLMRDAPRALHLPKAHSDAYPRLGVLAGGTRAPDAIQAVTECHLLTRHDAQVAWFILNRTLHCREPCLEILSIRLYPLILQWGEEVERQDVGRVVRHQGIEVLGMQSVLPLLDELPNLGFVTGWALVRS